MTELEGILAVHKPAGWTSHDVVAKVRRLVKMKRIGHAGTLDPEVTGVLPLCLGRATRVVEYMQELPKEYRAVLRLGLSTDTEDITGTVIESVETVNVTKKEAEETLRSFLGEISQVPPMYSAVKVDGKRLYELAREGKTVERKSRTVNIYEIEMTGFEEQENYTDISFRVLCSKGTYIRTLCVDIGRKLGLPSTMAKLMRTLSAGISSTKCLTLEQIEQFMEDGTLSSRLIPVDEAIVHLPAHTVTDEKRNAALQGQRLSARAVDPPVDHSECIRLYDREDRFLGIFQRQEETGAVVPVKVFSV
ncbi:tRNA pseudouridine55 synthase [Paenibacillus uliginis N3/975]|uniref:tRNA pseudouridine synthase B n=1 Tax=Paenibacillus uliginis N3/975 TaxID=1313296 RepID=A0A1X7H8X4_9BACL|nr:tRNA pseudouridine(55) synthase TruB [Paenibacillus uliginis]SMF81857.1 tRNA pseudouridine55 synthase [Paenibacillus uliginis N3/975]